MPRQIVDVYGRPLVSEKNAQVQTELARLRAKITNLTSKYDAAATWTGNEKHWGNADNLDPHSANTLAVRRKLRTRSRYELIENNPYLKGCAISIANDFVMSGPKLQITDEAFNKDQRVRIEREFMFWFEASKIRQKLWRARMARLVDGEAFFAAYNTVQRSPGYSSLPVTLDYYLLETDRVSNTDSPINQSKDEKVWEMDGVRWDKYDQPLQYHILRTHPGSTLSFNSGNDGTWVSATQMLHWFRQDRGWLRGIPELTPSLPLCALLRRYTLAVVQAAEVAASLTAVLETNGPPNQAYWDSTSDEPFDVMPIEHGMFTTLPWGYKMSAFKAEQPTTMYDTFVNALLREIVRPLLLPFNIAAGSSEDANMSSAVLDAHIYKSGQYQDRTHCEESVLRPMFLMWWAEASKLRSGQYLRVSGRIPYVKHSWRWDNIGLDHTDPSKIQNALKTAHDKGFLTDRDVQEKYYNRNVEEWRKELQEDADYREQLNNFGLRDCFPVVAPQEASNTNNKKESQPKKS